MKLQFWYAAYDFQNEAQGTLKIRKGQALKLLNRQDQEGNSQWWLVEDRDGNVGYVPADYLEQPK